MNEEEASEEDVPVCWLCERPLGEHSELHHPVPKAKKGRVKVPIHAICHQTIHANLTNSEIARNYADAESLRAHPGIAKFLAWIANKPPDFHAETR